MDQSLEENVQTLKAMGFEESRIRKALKNANNDLNDAVSYLTCEVGDSMNDFAMEAPPLQKMKNLDIPSYEDTIGIADNGSSLPDEDDGTFPLQHLLELEARVYCENWSIPYKKEESFCQCMQSTIKLMKNGTHETDQNCMRFLENCLPECFQKLLTSPAVTRWFNDVHDGIYEMANVFIKLLVERLTHQPLPFNLLRILSMVFDPSCQWNQRNGERIWAADVWVSKFGSEDEVFARPIPPTTGSSQPDVRDFRDFRRQKDSLKDFGWMINLINKFCEVGGLEKLCESLELNKCRLDAAHYAAVLEPFSRCGEFLNPPRVEPVIKSVLEKASEYINQLTDDDFKLKSLGSLSDLLCAMKSVCRVFWPNDLSNCDELRLGNTLRMIKCPHFNAKMNALKEISKMIEEINNSKSTSGYSPSSGNEGSGGSGSLAPLHIDEDKFHEWLSKNNILSVSLVGHIDKSQYADKIRVLVQFIGDKLGVDELAQLWKLQDNASQSVAENIQNVVSSAAVEFDAKQFDVLYQLIYSSWLNGDERARLQLISFIGSIGKKSKSSKSTDKVLTLLWDVAHLPKLSHIVVDTALREHHNILMDAFVVKDSVYKDFVVRCIEDIKRDQWIVPAFRQMHELLRAVMKSHSYRHNKTERMYLNELNRTHELIRLIVSSITKCHQMGVDAARQQGLPLHPDTLVDERYTHSEFMKAHLIFLKFLLKEGDLYMQWGRVRDLWDTMAGNKAACEGDVCYCCEWFVANLTDMDCNSITSLFKDRLLKIEVATMMPQMFECFLSFMEAVNMNEDKIKKSPGDIRTVEKLDLIGLDHLWRICLECLNPLVVEMAISNLVRWSYLDVGKKLKLEPQQLHLQFLTECCQRLEKLNVGISNVTATVTSEENTTLLDTVTTATKTLVGSVLPDINTNQFVNAKNQKSLTTERLLSIVYRYITSVEASYPVEPRHAVPHGESYYGAPIEIRVRLEEPSRTSDQCNSELVMFRTYANYPLRYLRVQISHHLDMRCDSIQMYVNKQLLPSSHERCSLEMLGFTETQDVFVKKVQPHSSSSDPPSNTDDNLPSLILARLGNKVYDTLFSLSDYDSAQLNDRVRRILLLLPSDPRIRQQVESINSGDSYSEISNGSSATMMKKEGVGIRSSPSPGCGHQRGDNKHNKCAHKNRTSRAFDCLFQLTSPGMNFFRLRYNLEVLSGILLPVTIPDSEVHDSSFLHAFLHYGGLETILKVLQREILQESNDKLSDPETKQGCYSVALQIARYILCIASVCDNACADDDGFRLSASSDAAHSPMKSRDSIIVGSAEASVTPIKRNRRSVSSRSPAVLSPEIPIVARTSVQLMSGDHFTSLIRNLTYISWYASAGKLDQLCSDALAVEMTAFSKNRKWSRESSCSQPPLASPFRHTSGGSVSSSTSSHDISAVAVAQQQQACLQSQAGYLNSLKSKVKENTESHVARQSLQIVVSCLQNRSSHLDSFFDMNILNDFVIDVLVRSPDLAIRSNAMHQLHLLSTIHSRGKKHPRAQLLQILTKCPLPFWRTNTILRAGAQALVNNCIQYFELLCRLMRDAIGEDHVEKMGVDEKGILTSEVEWLCEWEPPSSLEYFDATPARMLDNLLLTGHLRLITTLLTSPRTDKRVIGSRILARILNELLFPGAHLMMMLQSSNGGGNGGSDQSPSAFMPKCSTDESRNACFELVVELCKDCNENLKAVAHRLIEMHHFVDPSKIKEFGFTPMVVSRPDHGLVGLRNGGATCYMNSVLQQLFMINDIRRRILENDLIDDDEADKGVLFQLQKVFAHLSHSRLQYHNPETFWKSFKMWNQEINPREQQDAFEFLTHLTDQVDEFVKKKNQEAIFKRVFHGTFSDQKICEGCPHRYEREEPYYALNLPVKCGNLEESLKQFVAGEKLEGDNAYYCEKCGEKRTALKRTCIKTLPDVLVIQLKRFVYDWEAGRSVKFDQYFEFPHEIDMKPYLSEQVEKKDSTIKRQASSGEYSDDLYELCGVVVHSGQAQAGHYYSFIRDRRKTRAENAAYDKWFKFNDNTVEEFYMSPRTLEEECYGGSFVGKFYDKGTAYDDERVRYWSAYLLFYQRRHLKQPPQQQQSSPSSKKFGMSDEQQPPKSKRKAMNVVVPPSPLAMDSGNSSCGDDDAAVATATQRQHHRISISQLSHLIKKGEQQGVFNSQIPSSIIKLVQEENIHFMHDCGMYCDAYFNFIKDLVHVNIHRTSAQPNIAEQSIMLTAQFLFNTYFKLKTPEMYEHVHWQNFIRKVLSTSPQACQWLATHLRSCSGIVSAYMLECPYDGIRSAFTQILNCLVLSMTNSMNEEGRSSFLDPLLSLIASLMDREVIERVRYSEEYFTFFSDYSSRGRLPCEILLRHDVFARMIRFLLGDKATKCLFRKAQPVTAAEDGSGDASTTTNNNNVSFMSCDEDGSGDKDEPMSVDGEEGDGDDDDDDVSKLPRRWTSSTYRYFSVIHHTIGNVMMLSDMTSLCSEGKIEELPPSPPPQQQQNTTPSSKCDLIQRLNNDGHKLLPLNDAVRFTVNGPLSKRYFSELLHFVRESNDKSSFTLAKSMIVYCARDNHGFSLMIIQLMMSELSTLNASDTKDVLALLAELLFMKDSLQSERLKDTFEKVENNFLVVLERCLQSDETKCYQCIKFFVQLSSRMELCHQYLMDIASRWSNAVTWLKRKMNDHTTFNNSKQESSNKFHRTMSAQNTLEKATALLACVQQDKTPPHRSPSTTNEDEDISL